MIARQSWIVEVLLILGVAALSGLSHAQTAGDNLLPNPSFELVEPPPPNAEQAAKGAQAPPETWLPRTWNVWAQDGGVYKCPDDAAQAHSGRRCVCFEAARGAGVIRYGPMPVPDAQPWTIRFWARGKGQLVAGGYKVLPDRWDRLPKEWSFTLEEKWKAFEFQFSPGETCKQWMLDLATRGPTETWIDDVFITYPGLKTLGLPPDKPVTKDEHTLLYLPFEGPLNEEAYFIKGKVSLSGEGEGRFGKGLVLGPEGYAACSANENLDPQQGTIELWVKLLSPGNDGVYRSFVAVPGPEGMMLCKDQYSHMAFAFASGWGATFFTNATAMGYANSWQPGVWRHVAACWDKDLMQLFVDGKLVAWKCQPRLSRALGPELGIGSEGMELDDLRISNIVRYRQAVPPP